MAHIQAVRLIELNKGIGLRGNNGCPHVTRSDSLYVFYGCLCPTPEKNIETL